MTRRIAFVFPGQGAQYVGMGAAFVHEFPEVRAVFDAADEALGFSISKLCLEGPEESLRSTENTQPAILTVSCALLELIQSRTDLRPVLVAGHSLGEYAALVCAGVLTFADAVRIVRERGRLMEQAVPTGTGGMAAILGLEHDVVASLCRQVDPQYGVVEPATLNGPGQIVVAGDKQALDVVLSLAKEAGARRAVPLVVSGPFHSSLLRGAGEQLAAVLADAQWREAQIPVVSNVTAEPLTELPAIRQALIDQVSSAVRWEESIGYMVRHDIDTFIEIGPGKVLSGLIRRIDRSVTVLDVDEMASWDKLLAWAKGDGII